ncbi:uncharacterized protein LOC117590251 [Drosophila guanche]|uniref:Uncharacterized protein n=1 Tax=Drosophila guanche TaxID=7266 RepID=A0A3B0K2M4_DROGU|nr:uncharacterized protein LOC117590251 [Drosophila guanche]SPP88517.1 Hypothetical predicted protein [Drosophila guanche]
MSKCLVAFCALSCLLALALAEPRLQQRQLLRQSQQSQQSQQQHPYLFLSIPRGLPNAGAVVKGFEIVEEADDDDADQDNEMLRQPQDDDEDIDDDEQFHDDDDDEDELEHQLGLNFARHGQLVLLNNPNSRRNNFQQDEDLVDDDSEDDDDEPLPAVGNLRKTPNLSLNLNQANGQQLLKNAKATQMVIPRDQAGAIMVPDGIIEIEGQSVIDEKTGKAALLVPRAALDAIPDGAVVALMERSSGVAAADAIEEERANRVIVRRRKNNGRRNVRRRGSNSRRRRRGGNRRRRVGGNRRPNVHVIRPTGNRQRAGQRRRGGQVVLQG